MHGHRLTARHWSHGLRLFKSSRPSIELSFLNISQPHNFDVKDGKPDVPSLPHLGNAVCKSLRELYTAWSQVVEFPEDFDLVPYMLLNPKMLVRLGKTNNSAALSHDCFPFLFRASIMMRSMGIRFMDFMERKLLWVPISHSCV